MIKLISEILFFAIAMTILLAWGYIKQQKKNNLLFKKLINNAEIRIIDYLKENETITKHKIEEMIKDTKASLYWSKSKLKIVEPKSISISLINDLVEKKLIERDLKNKYTLAK